LGEDCTEKMQANTIVPLYKLSLVINLVEWWSLSIEPGCQTLGRQPLLRCAALLVVCFWTGGGYIGASSSAGYSMQAIKKRCK